MSISPDFENYGGSYLLSQQAAAKYIYGGGNDFIGRHDGQFMIPSNQMDELLNRHPNDPRAWEKQLGIEEYNLGNHPVRVDVYSPQAYNLREPTVDLSGSNDKFTGDGKTSGGYNEAVIDPFPNPNHPGNEHIGQITPINVNLSEHHNTSSAESMPPDRRPQWPSSDPQNLSSGKNPPTGQQQPTGPNLTDIDPPRNPQISGNPIPAGPLGGTNFTQSPATTPAQNVAQDADSLTALPTPTDAQKAAKSVTGGIT